MGFTYVISDVHGHLDCFEAILEKINLQPDDRLYIFGDVIDRGFRGIEILKRVMDMPNAEMLLGNHEFMMLNALGEPYDGIRRSTIDSMVPQRRSAYFRRSPEPAEENQERYRGLSEIPAAEH